MFLPLLIFSLHTLIFIQFCNIIKVDNELILNLQSLLSLSMCWHTIRWRMLRGQSHIIMVFSISGGIHMWLHTHAHSCTDKWVRVHACTRETKRDRDRERIKVSLLVQSFDFNHLNTTKQRNIYGPFYGDRDFRLWCLFLTVLGWGDMPN